jgi:hypothetical protein
LVACGPAADISGRQRWFTALQMGQELAEINVAPANGIRTDGNLDSNRSNRGARNTRSARRLGKETR